MRRAITVLAALAVAAGTVVLGAGSASADPSANDWKQLRLCESGDNYSVNTGNGYYGAYQFDLATWRSVGGSGRPDQASKAEQDLRALTLYRMRGWAPWICAALVGLTEDNDGGSGAPPSSGGGGSTPAPPSSGVPSYPGGVAFGAYSAALKAFQKRLAATGYGTLEGTGWYGAKTKAAVIKLQRKAGLSANGTLTSATWKAAWDAKNNLKTPTKTPTKPPTTKPPTSTKTAYPGKQLHYGDYSAPLKKWQKQMAAMGYGELEGTGWFGPKTKAAVLALQRKAGLHVVGYIGPSTWAAAWNSKYTKVSTAPATPKSTTPKASTPKTGAKYRPASDATCKVTSTTALEWGGMVMVRGKTYRDLQCFQRVLGERGYGLTGTGFFGSSTASALAKFQAAVGVPRTGKVDQATWKAAWEKR